MHVEVEHDGGIRFAATNASGWTIHTDGGPAYGGREQGFRPMELVLTALAGCAGIDIVGILDKGRQPYERLSVRVEGDRGEGVPAPFTEIRLHWRAEGAVDPKRFGRAVELAVGKYCSVGVMLSPTVRIRWRSEVLGHPDGVREGEVQHAAT